MFHNTPSPISVPNSIAASGEKGGSDMPFGSEAGQACTHRRRWGWQGAVV
jgi:hypothetical protein